MITRTIIYQQESSGNNCATYKLWKNLSNHWHVSIRLVTLWLSAYQKQPKGGEIRFVFIGFRVPVYRGTENSREAQSVAPGADMTAFSTQGQAKAGASHEVYFLKDPQSHELGNTSKSPSLWGTFQIQSMAHKMCIVGHRRLACERAKLQQNLIVGSHFLLICILWCHVRTCDKHMFISSVHMYAFSL